MRLVCNPLGENKSEKRQCGRLDGSKLASVIAVILGCICKSDGRISTPGLTLVCSMIWRSFSISCLYLVGKP